MHLHKFADACTFSEPAIGGSLPATDVIREFFKKLHPKQMLTGRITFPVYEIEYSYTTVRGNLRTGKKYFISNYQEDDNTYMAVEMQLDAWVMEYNRTYPFKKIDNVSILSISKKADGCLSIG